MREIETASTTGISPNQYPTSQPQCDILAEEGGTCEEERTLLRAIVALEDLGLTVLHLNITSSQATVLYSFNLKLEDDCKLGSTDEVAAAAHQIFSSINDEELADYAEGQRHCLHTELITF
ncbi:hypothetical protein NC652_032080 [Populus alba x Populus x berolinensis]|nr:hypothetical protein NC652_032080 [Populus alba x Populus x berolinensis]